MPISENGVTLNYWASCESASTPCLATEGELRLSPDLESSSRHFFSSCAKTRARTAVGNAKNAMHEPDHYLAKPVHNGLTALCATTSRMSRAARSMVARPFADFVIIIVVGSVPTLQDLFFGDNGFVKILLVNALAARRRCYCNLVGAVGLQSEPKLRHVLFFNSGIWQGTMT